MLISSTLKNWYLQKKRNLPWRISLNPYHTWVSEVILQQTRVLQGVGYFNRFIDRFPDIKSLAAADIEDVMKLWQGLGYYSRARNLHEGAKYVLAQYHGQLPPDYKKLLAIHGIGAYTAAAIGSIAFNLPYPVVDGNVNRVLARLFGVHDPVNAPEGIRRIKVLAEAIFDPEDPGTHNQALMEFGALHCLIKNPLCSDCPLQMECYAFLHNETNLLPVKIGTAKPRNRYFNYIVIFSGVFTFLKKRHEKDIWEGLYEFPLLETDTRVNPQELKNHDGWEMLFKDRSSGILPLKIVEAKRHLLSHQTIHATYYIIHITGAYGLSPEYIKVNWEDVHKYPVSKLIDNFIILQSGLP